MSFVVEDERHNIVGVAVAAFHAKDFRAKLNTNWKKVLKEKYSIPSMKEGDFLKVGTVYVLISTGYG